MCFWWAKKKKECSFEWPNLTQTSLHLFIMLFVLLEIRMTKLNDTPTHTHTHTHVTAFSLPRTLLFSPAADGPGDRFIIGESQAGEQVCTHVDIQTRLLFLTHKNTPSQRVLCMSMKSFASGALPHTVAKCVQNTSTHLKSADILLEGVAEPLLQSYLIGVCAAHPHRDAWSGDEGDDRCPHPMWGRCRGPGGGHRTAPRVWRCKSGLKIRTKISWCQLDIMISAKSDAVKHF